MLNDILGREIKVGDIICYSSGSYVGVITSVVTKINPKTITTTKGLHQPSNVLIVTEQFGCSGKQGTHDKMIDEAKRYFDFATPVAKTSTKWRYVINIVGEKGGKVEDIRVYIGKIEANTNSELRTNISQWVKDNIPANYNGGKYGYKASVYQNRASYRSTHKNVVSTSYGLNDLPLQTLKDLGIEDWIDTFVSFETFKVRVAKMPKNHFDWNGFLPEHMLQ